MTDFMTKYLIKLFNADSNRIKFTQSSIDEAVRDGFIVHDDSCVDNEFLLGINNEFSLVYNQELERIESVVYEHDESVSYKWTGTYNLLVTALIAEGYADVRELGITADDLPIKCIMTDGSECIIKGIEHGTGKYIVKELTDAMYYVCNKDGLNTHGLNSKGILKVVKE